MAYKIIIFSIIIFLFLLITPFAKAAYNASDCLGQLDSSNACVYTKGLTNNSSGNRGLNGVRYSEIDIVNHRLFVSDQLNNRVLIYNLDSSNNLIDRVADKVLGQPNFTTNIPAVTQNGMTQPLGLAYDATNNRLFVVEPSINRILVFNVASITDGESAVNVLGQTDFISSAPAVTQSGLSIPNDVTYDSANDRLFVDNLGSHRVVIYNTAIITDGEDAVNVLGQTDFISSTPATTQNGMWGPRGVTYDSVNNRLIVGDRVNHRVLFFDISSITDGEDAVNVLGQADFTSQTIATTQSGLHFPYGIDYDSTNNRLFVADLFNNRVMVFDTRVKVHSASGYFYKDVDGSNTVTASDIRHSSAISVISAYSATGANEVIVVDTTLTDSSDEVLSFGTITTGQTIILTETGADTNTIGAITGTLVSTGGFTCTAYDADNGGGSSTTAMASIQSVKCINGSANVVVFNTDTDLVTDLVAESTTITLITSTYASGATVASTDSDLGLTVSFTNANGYNADNVLGQSDFVSSTAATTQSGMSSPIGLVYDSANNRIYVPDLTNNRVSIFDVASITDGENAVDLLGQLDSSDSPVYTTAYTNNVTTNNIGFNITHGVVLDTINHRLFVSDRDNNRILIYELDANNNLVDRLPERVLGQSNFTSNMATTTQSGLSSPRFLTYDSANNRLFVAEVGNDRILVFDVVSITNGENAVNVLGQADFTSNSTGVTQSTVNNPAGLAYDSTNGRLFVTDNTNNRVLVFDVASITDGENAVNVLGQTNFTSNSTATTQSGMNNPNSLAYDSANNRLFVSDYINNRVLVFDVTSITNGENAVYVLGQVDFTSSANALAAFGNLNIPWYVYVLVTILLIILLLFTSKHLPKWVAVVITILIILLIIFGFLVYVAFGGLSQMGMSNPSAPSYDSVNNRLFVSDNSNNRILLFDTTTINNGENAIAILGQDDYVTNTAKTTQDGIYSPSGLAYDSSLNRLYFSDGTNSRVLIFNFIRSTSSVTNTTVGDTYSETLSSTNSQGTVTWAVSSGSLPPGLSLDSSTGIISGASLIAGTTTFSVQATDTTATGTFLSPPHPLTIIVSESQGTGAIATPEEARQDPAGGSESGAPDSGGEAISFYINNGVPETNNSKVTLNFSAVTNPEIKSLTISTNPDLEDSVIQDYQDNLIYNLCQNQETCQEGEYTLYTKLYTKWGRTTDILSDSIYYRPQPNSDQSLVKTNEKIINSPIIKEVKNEVPQNTKSSKTIFIVQPWSNENWVNSTLSGIAFQSNLSIKNVLKLNPEITNRDLVKVGQKIILGD